jgi:hypothetical protein
MHALCYVFKLGILRCKSYTPGNPWGLQGPGDNSVILGLPYAIVSLNWVITDKQSNRSSDDLTICLAVNC